MPDSKPNLDEEKYEHHVYRCGYMLIVRDGELVEIGPRDPEYEALAARLQPLPEVKRYTMHEEFVWGYADPRVMRGSQPPCQRIRSPAPELVLSTLAFTRRLSMSMRGQFRTPPGASHADSTTNNQRDLYP